QQRKRAAGNTGVDESVVCGRGRVGESEAVLVVFEFGYLGGSVGQAAGNRIVAAFERARQLRLPVVTLVASGGSRVQEGIVALARHAGGAAASAAPAGGRRTGGGAGGHR